MIKEWIAEYGPKNSDDVLSALREIMQEVALAGPSRTNFFEKAAFYRGTSLRIFYGLDRFSEDLDFSLLKEDPNFSLEPYFESIVDEFKAVGMQVSIRKKDKTNKTYIDSAFLKPTTEWKELVLENIVKQEGIKTTNRTIKIEIDRRPPLGFETENKLLTRPFFFYVKCFDKPSLFAGKMHALLFRKWGTRVKGRDWYDFEWYVKKKVFLLTCTILLCVLKIQKTELRKKLQKKMLLNCCARNSSRFLLIMQKKILYLSLKTTEYSTFGKSSTLTIFWTN